MAVDYDVIDLLFRARRGDVVHRDRIALDGRLVGNDLRFVAHGCALLERMPTFSWGTGASTNRFGLDDTRHGFPEALPRYSVLAASLQRVEHSANPVHSVGRDEATKKFQVRRCVSARS